MSDPTPPDDLDPEEHDDLIAAEYVLGTLPTAERRAARDRVDLDTAFAARVRAWEARLEPLNEAYDAVEAPDLLPQIENRLFGRSSFRLGAVPDAAPGRGWASGWRGGVLATAAMAAALALAVTLWPPAPAPAILRADLASEDTDLRFAARWDGAAGVLEITRTDGTAPPEGADHQLWLIDATGAPRPLGLLRGPVTEVATALAPGVTLAVSLEPTGGSPGDAPTGPVLAAGALDGG